MQYLISESRKFASLPMAYLGYHEKDVFLASNVRRRPKGVCDKAESLNGLKIFPRTIRNWYLRVNCKSLSWVVTHKFMF